MRNRKIRGNDTKSCLWVTQHIATSSSQVRDCLQVTEQQGKEKEGVVGESVPLSNQSAKSQDWFYKVHAGFWTAAIERQATH